MHGKETVIELCVPYRILTERIGHSNVPGIGLFSDSGGFVHGPFWEALGPLPGFLKLPGQLCSPAACRLYLSLIHISEPTRH